MTEKELLLLALKFIGVDETAAEALYSDGSLNAEAKATVSNAIKAKADRIKNDLTAKYNSGHASAKAEVLTQRDEEWRKKYGIDNDDLVGESLLQEIIKVQSKVTEESIKANPMYMQVHKELSEAQKKIKQFDSIKKELDETKSKYTQTTLRTHFEKTVSALKPVLSKDPAKAQRQLNDLFDIIKNNQVTFDKDGNPIPIDKDGNQIQDEQGNDITFDNIVKLEVLNRYDLDTNAGRQSAGSRGAAGTGTDASGSTYKGITLSKPKDTDDYYRQKELIQKSADLSAVEKSKALVDLAKLDSGIN